jgi:Mg/Co/Ni transporter MgtE
MVELPQLTLAFLRERPESAARAIEGLPVDDAATILGTVPVRIAAPVVGAMSSAAAARAALKLPAETAAAICESLPWADASALLRQLDADGRSALLEQLPTTLASRFRRSLAYVEHAVGAWIEMDLPVIVEDRTVAEATRLLEGHRQYSASHLLLSDQAQRSTGIVSLASLLRAEPDTELTVLAQRDCRPVRDMAPVATVAALPDWEATSILPVVNHRGELLGGITRRTLNAALRNLSHAEPAPPLALLPHLLDACLVAGDGLLRLLVHPAVPASDRPGGRRT